MDEYIKSDSIPLEAYLKAKKYSEDEKSLFMVKDVLKTNKSTESVNEIGMIADMRNRIDAQTSAKVLPFHIPIKTYSLIERSLWKFSIRDIKMFLSQGGNVKNFLVTDDGIKRYRCSSEEKMQKLEILIKLYDEQVDRLLEIETNKGNFITPKLFYKDNDRKKEIVLQNLDPIGKNFVKAGSEFVFGVPSNIQLSNILYSTNKQRTKVDSLADRFADIITYYSTLEELENNPINPPAINRLVKK